MNCVLITGIIVGGIAAAFLLLLGLAWRQAAREGYVVEMTAGETIFAATPKDRGKIDYVV